MKYFVLTLFFCAFVATAFSVPVAQDEAQDLVAKFQGAIPKLVKVEAGLRRDGLTEYADELKQVIPGLKTFYTNINFVENNLLIARHLWKYVENLLNDTRRYWDESSSLSVASTESLNKTISNLLANSEIAKNLVAKFQDAIPKLVKVEAGLRRDGLTEYADELKLYLETLKTFYTNVDFVEKHIAKALENWMSVQYLLNMTKKYWDESSSLSVALTKSLNKAISKLFANSEAQDLVAKFQDAIPKLVNI